MTEEEKQAPISIPDLDQAAAKPSRPGAGIRWMLFLAQMAVMFLAFMQVPGSHAFELGYSLGWFMILSCIVLWTLLCFADTTRHLLFFCLLALGQAGFFEVIALRYQAEDRVLREVEADTERQKQVWGAQMAPYSMDALNEMLDGQRPWTLEGLNEINARAKGAQAELRQLEAESKQWEEKMVERIAKVSSQGARDFRRGADSRRAEGEEIFKTLGDLYRQDEQLTGFLIGRQGHYRVRKQSFDFDSDQDAQTFNHRIAEIRELREKLGAELQKAEETTKKLGQNR
jgi:hypothetical protein